MENSENLNIWMYLIMIIPFIYAGFVWPNAPDQIPIHFNINGEADDYGSKNWLFWAPLLLIGINFLIFKIIPYIDPKKRFEQMGDSYQKIMFLMMCLMSAISIFIIYAANSGGNFQNNLLTALLGLFFMAFGNYMPTIKPNYFVGFRTPWTLENDHIWRKTHRLAGRFFMVGGLVVTIFSLFLNPKFAFYLLMSTVFVITLIPAIFSYLEYRKV